MNAQAKWNKENSSLLTIRFTKANPQDEAILKHLKQQKSKAGYIKDLIKEDMKK